VERSIQKNGLVNLLVLLAAGVAAFTAARYANSWAGQVAAVFAGLGVLVAFVSWFQMRLEESERLEKLELEEMARSKASATLFEAKAAEIFPAQQSREQFDRYFVPIFTAALLLAQGTGAFLLWRWLSKATPTGVAPERWIVAASGLALTALILFLLGRFSVTIARLENHRLLRPSASYLLLSAYLCAIAAAAIAAVKTEFPYLDAYAARALCLVLGLMAVETLVTLILEIYRPRVKGKVHRPLYESRLVGLLGQPEGLITTAAQALDYQFGFKVSETWFYRFFEKALGWLILLQLGVLMLSTCVVFIEPGEQALLERFGRPIQRKAEGSSYFTPSPPSTPLTRGALREGGGREGGEGQIHPALSALDENVGVPESEKVLGSLAGGTLGPGAHLKLPWPIDKVYRHRAEQVQTVHVGFSPEEEDGHGHRSGQSETAELWTAAHGKEDNFLVANRERFGISHTERKAPPVSLLSVNVPVQFQVRDLHAWVYHHKDAAKLLQQISTREVVRYLVSADLNEIMSAGRLEAAAALREGIQAAADAHQLGAHILFVGLQGIHPPVKVAPEYEKVVGAIHQKQAKVLGAEADAIRTNALAGAQAFAITNNAEAQRVGLQIGAWSRAAAFTNQIPAFNAAPSVYPQRAYYQMLPRATASARKYVLLATNVDEVISFNLEDKFGQDLFQLTVPPPKK
jgi:regulator of protease activity HflC (stomatin/prohibitin superfamily)